MMKTYIRSLTILAAMLLLMVVPAGAEQGVGTSPYVAHLLTNGLNVGSLSPGQSFWYSYSQDDLGSANIQSIILNLVFKPGDSRTARQVTFDAYTFDQVKTYLENNQTRSRKTGSGQLTTADYDTDTGERLWAGAVEAGEIYYIHIKNGSGLTVDYRLSALSQQIVLPAAPPTGVAAAAVSTSASYAGLPQIASTAPILPAGPETGEASPWLLAAQTIQNLPPAEAAAWLSQAVELGWLPGAAPAEAGAVVDLSVNAPQTRAGEIIAGYEVEPVVADNSIYPNDPLILENKNVNQLAPYAQHWYTFLSDDFDEELFEEKSLTMFLTPGEGNVANRVNFQLFTGDQYQIWQRGTPDEMTNFGAGQLVSRDNDPDTGERLWRGLVVDGDRYYIQVKNDTDRWIDYYLLGGDIVNTELGAMSAPNPRRQSAAPSQNIVDVQLPDNSPPGSSIAKPLPAGVGFNRGRLKAGEDVWYAFRFQNFDRLEPEFRHYKMYLKHAPGNGYIANYVNLELYTYPALDLWLRGDGLQTMVPMGAGSRGEYDKINNAQTFVWAGELVSDNTYFLRVRNDSESDIFFDLDIQERR